MVQNGKVVTKKVKGHKVGTIGPRESEREWASYGSDSGKSSLVFYSLGCSLQPQNTGASTHEMSGIIISVESVWKVGMSSREGKV